MREIGAKTYSRKKLRDRRSECTNTRASGRSRRQDVFGWPPPISAAIVAATAVKLFKGGP
jgi:hypothetical protein